ncbi:type II secretion system F family protein, partial [Acinetobacter baumannii]
SRVLGTVLYGGVPMLDALSIAGRATGNRFLETSSYLVQTEVREGRRIADAMRDAGAFPPIVTQMISVGEETGDLPLMLTRISESLDFEVDN